VPGQCDDRSPRTAVAYRTPLTIRGVPSSLYSGRSPKLSVLMRHRDFEIAEFDALI